VEHNFQVLWNLKNAMSLRVESPVESLLSSSHSDQADDHGRAHSDSGRVRLRPAALTRTATRFTTRRGRGRARTVTAAAVPVAVTVAAVAAAWPGSDPSQLQVASVTSTP
jgi:hypothetical protein